MCSCVYVCVVLFLSLSLSLSLSCSKRQPLKELKSLNDNQVFRHFVFNLHRLCLLFFFIVGRTRRKTSESGAGDQIGTKPVVVLRMKTRRRFVIWKNREKESSLCLCVVGTIFLRTENVPFFQRKCYTHRCKSVHLVKKTWKSKENVFV